MPARGSALIQIKGLAGRRSGRARLTGEAHELAEEIARGIGARGDRHLTHRRELVIGTQSEIAALGVGSRYV
jgi:hypothetical protein